MARSALFLALALAALTSSAAAQALDGASLTKAAARFAKNKGGSGSRCSIGTPEISYAIDGRPGTTDHPMTPGIASQFIANQVSARLALKKKRPVFFINGRAFGRLRPRALKRPSFSPRFPLSVRPHKQAKPPLLNHYTTTFDCVDSR